ncbi:EamA family transporter [Pseudokineococcus basanitobsidens]|uniref:EamA family transporter n=1 Tax=Pseudokineococcus basanitobsidens TaxID=1926649 RepID=A0ABU8RLN0_9ACTN
MLSRTSWIPYAGLLVLFWGVWGAFSATPTDLYGYPDEMIYVIWSLTMLVPAAVVLRGARWDRRGVATAWGLTAGLTGAGGQLLLFRALSDGPAYLIFPLVALSPAVTVLLAVGLLRERLARLAVVGLVLALVAVVLFSVSGGGGVDTGVWLPLALVVTVAWGVQAFAMRKAGLNGVNDATTFGWMTISGLVLVPLAFWSMGGFPGSYVWQAPVLTAGTQLLNAVGALFLVMALTRGRASVVSPVTNALAPVLTVVLSLVVFQTLPSPYGAVGIVLALVGSTLMVYSDEKSGESAVTEGASRPVAERSG